MASNDWKDASGPAPAAAIGILLAGLVLTAVSFAPLFQSGSERWTADRAREYQDASLEIQELTHELGGRSPESAKREDSQKLNDALQHFQVLQQELKDAQAQSGGLAVLLRAAGIVLMVVGVVMFVVRRRPASSDDDNYANLT